MLEGAGGAATSAEEAEAGGPWSSGWSRERNQGDAPTLPAGRRGKGHTCQPRNVPFRPSATCTSARTPGRGHPSSRVGGGCPSSGSSRLQRAASTHASHPSGDRREALRQPPNLKTSSLSPTQMRYAWAGKGRLLFCEVSQMCVCTEAQAASCLRHRRTRAGLALPRPALGLLPRPGVFSAELAAFPGERAGGSGLPSV